MPHSERSTPHRVSDRRRGLTRGRALGVTFALVLAAIIVVVPLLPNPLQPVIGRIPLAVTVVLALQLVLIGLHLALMRFVYRPSRTVIAEERDDR